MTEYLKRQAGGFYVIDEPELPERVVTVRRAVNQVINPKTGTPFPERDPIENYWTKYFEDDRRLRNEALWREQYECTWSNTAKPVDLSEEGISRACVDMVASMSQALLR